MPTRNRLSALQVKNAAPGKYADGGGLWLHRRADGGAQWFLRFHVHGRRREMGLGSLVDVSLKEARTHADHWRSVAREGRDPIKERERERREIAKADHSLASVALEAFEARKAELKNDGRPGRWFSPLELHILPKLGNVIAPGSVCESGAYEVCGDPFWERELPELPNALKERLRPRPEPVARPPRSPFCYTMQSVG